MQLSSKPMIYKQKHCMEHLKWLPNRDKIDILPILFPAAWNPDVMAGALAATLDHKDERYAWQIRQIEGLWVSDNS